MLVGNISEFSLPELFKMIAEGNKSGMLSLVCSSKFLSKSKIAEAKNYYIWFKKGEIVAASNRLDGKGLISMMSRRAWIDNDELSDVLFYQKLTTALGSLLKSQQLIGQEELEILFRMQVSREVMPLFEVKDAPFKFYENVSAPLTELTGLTVSVKSLLLRSLRVLKDWSIFQAKLPSLNSILVNNNLQETSDLNLDEWEKRILQLVPENYSLQQIASKLKLHFEQVQQISFRLICIGMVEEIPVVVASNQPVETQVEHSISEKALLSKSYINNLVDFLGGHKSHSVAA